MSVRKLLRHKDLKRFVVNRQGLGAGETVFSITVNVVNYNAKIVLGINFFDKDVGAVSLKRVICSIKCDVMWVSKAIADT